ncbi:MAG TPA: ATP-dependent DNA helicase [Desulfobacteraceae bacterium]|nr:ATP-dependent DNA helicase [Desulfobacteraceae bacterium]
MENHKKRPAYYKEQRKKKPKAKQNLIVAQIKPGADPSLKKVFAQIGVPEKSRFKPDPFQVEAVLAIETSDCLVTAPTGAGKTWIAEQAIKRVLAEGGRIWYASPLKALTNAKYIEFSNSFGAENVGILTGDRKENQDAPLITGTTEILRNQLYDAMHHGESLNTELVILDEAHFLGDPERGVVWEEIMIYLPTRISLLLLSATIGNGRHIARWLKSIRSKECFIIEETKRPVPLVPLFFHPSGKLYPLLAGSRAKAKLHKKVSAYMESKHPPLLAPAYKLPPFGEIIKVLREYDLLPAIFFLKSRADCDNALTRCTETLSKEKRDFLSGEIDEIISRQKHIAGHRQMKYLRNRGVGAHHSGQLPLWKIVLEALMTKGLLEAVFATSTVAAGVNFPARSILIFNSDRFNGKDFIPLSSTEFHQMTGRAGRRGMDNIGFAVNVPGKFMNINLVAKLVSAHPSDVLSQIRINFSMILNLLLSHEPKQIEELLQRSFLSWLIKRSRKKKSDSEKAQYGYKHLDKDFTRHLDFLIHKRYAEKTGKLTEDGIWASKLRVDQPLMIAECFRLNILPQSDSPLLAAIFASFVNEREFNEAIKNDLIPENLLEAFDIVNNNLVHFTKEMTEQKFATRDLFLLPAVVIYHWAMGKSWEDVLLISKMQEGNLAMLILRTADNLRHIGALSETFPEAAKTAMDAIDLIVREPVVIDYQL